jgi:hypothetical protein
MTMHGMQHGNRALMLLVVVAATLGAIEVYARHQKLKQQVMERGEECAQRCNHGDCIVDTCFCDKGYHGKYCEAGAPPDCPVTDMQSFPIECAVYMDRSAFFHAPRLAAP